MIENLNLENIRVTGVVALFIITLPEILEKIPPILEGIATILTVL